MNTKIRNYIIELVGTYIYVFINLYFKNAIITGLSLAIIIIAGHFLLYKGHFNPAVTLSMLLIHEKHINNNFQTTDHQNINLLL